MDERRKEPDISGDKSVSGNEEVLAAWNMGQIRRIQ